MVVDIEENVTQLIEKPDVKYEDPPMYRSKFRKAVQLASARGKSAHKTLGLPRVSLNSPTEFLRKRTRTEVKRTDVKHKHYHIPDYQHKLPVWERQKNLNSANNKLETLIKNFKKENIIKIKNLQTKRPVLYYVDDRYGNSFPHKPNNFSISSNLKNKDDVQRNALKKQRYQKRKLPEEKKDDKNGKVRQIASIDKKFSRNESGSNHDEKELLTKKEFKNQNMCRYVTQEERKELLDGLHKKWEELMKQFQSLPFLIDTPSKIKRKTKLEQELKQLEKDIDMIERHSHIYVYSDDDN